MLYGQTLNMFLVLYDSTFSQFWTKNHKYSFETRFTECVGTEVFGIHTVVNFRQIYDEKMKSSVMQEVKHPDTIYVLPDLLLPDGQRNKGRNGENETKTTENGFELSMVLQLSYLLFTHTCFI